MGQIPIIRYVFFVLIILAILTSMALSSAQPINFVDILVYGSVVLVLCIALFKQYQKDLNKSLKAQKLEVEGDKYLKWFKKERIMRFLQSFFIILLGIHMLQNAQQFGDAYSNRSDDFIFLFVNVGRKSILFLFFVEMSVFVISIFLTARYQDRTDTKSE